MRFVRFFGLAFLVSWLAACATTPSGPPLVLNKLQAMGIDSRTYAKIADGRVLTYNDIYGLVKKGVPSKIILDYVKSTHAQYKFTDAQLLKLVDTGAKGSLVDYLGQGSGFYVATKRHQTGQPKFNWLLDPYFTDPYYMGAPPFAWSYPVDWYNPAYVGEYFP